MAQRFYLSRGYVRTAVHTLPLTATSAVVLKKKLI